MHVASCSKFVTAIAVTRLLSDKGMSADTPIISFLPAYWAKGPNIDTITFRHLLTHTSGFATDLSDSDFGFMKAHVAAGVLGVGMFDYENMNFGLCRILISTLLGAISPQATFPRPGGGDDTDATWDVVCINTYVQYVHALIFGPAGVVGATLDHPQPDALAYTFPVGSGWNSGDLRTMSGGAGWHLSVDDLLAVMGLLRRGGSIMSPAAAQAMLDDSFGVDDQRPTPLGRLYFKGGLWESKEHKVEQCLLFVLPRGMELVVFVNSPIGSPAKWFPGVVIAAFTSAIQPAQSVRGYFQRQGVPVTSSVHASAGAGGSVRSMLLT